MNDKLAAIWKARSEVMRNHDAYKQQDLLRVLMHHEYLRDLLRTTEEFSHENLNRANYSDFTIFGMKIIRTTDVETFEIVMRMHEVTDGQAQTKTQAHV